MLTTLLFTTLTALPPLERPAEPPVIAMSYGPGANIVLQINLERHKAGLKPLEISDQFTCTSSIQAAYLAEMDGHCSHTDLQPRVEACGGWLAAGEVQGCGHKSEIELVEAMLKSPPHAKLILDPEVKRAGAAVLDNKWVVTLGW